MTIAWSSGGILLTLLVFSLVCTSGLHVAAEDVLYQTLRSKPMTLTPGGVYRRFQNIPWTPGHIAIRSFNAELVDESGAPVPLSDVYLHHWIVARALVKASEAVDELHDFPDNDLDSTVKLWPNAGTCENGALSQWFGVGSETRKTDLSFPAPYGVETGNPLKVPEGWQEAWLVQIHAIDTRGAINAADCLECRCDAYNATVGMGGHVLPDGYVGGLWCCYEGVTCATQPGFPPLPKTFYLQYTIGYVPFDECVVPLRIYILDVTDNGLPMKAGEHNSCQVEYDVVACNQDGTLGSCQASSNQIITFPDNGRLVYTVGHLHAGGTGVTLWGEDERLICDSPPIYGRGSQAGDEAGYVVGMGVCRHTSPRDRVAAGEKLTIRSTYDSWRYRSGVMGLMYLAVAVDGDYTHPENGSCAIGSEEGKFLHPWGDTFLPVVKDDWILFSVGGGIVGFVLGGTFVAVAALLLNFVRTTSKKQYTPLLSTSPLVSA